MQILVAFKSVISLQSPAWLQVITLYFMIYKVRVMDLFKDIELQTGEREFEPDTLFLHPVVKLFAMPQEKNKNKIGYYPDHLENLVGKQSPSLQVKLVGCILANTKKT